MHAPSSSPASHQEQEVHPFVGFVETTVDALRIVAAARLLNESERRTLVKSGAVFCYGIEESGVRRWTDGLLWSPSRVLGNFLVYREAMPAESHRGQGQTQMPRIASSTASDRLVRDRSRSEGGLGILKPNGLYKKTISLQLEGVDYHLVAYFSEDDLTRNRLPRPATRADIGAVPITPAMVRTSDFRHPPSVHTAADGTQHIVDTEELEADQGNSSTSASRREMSSNEVLRSSPTQHQTFMHRWAVAVPEGDIPLQSPATFTMSFPSSPTSPPTTTTIGEIGSPSTSIFHGEAEEHDLSSAPFNYRLASRASEPWDKDASAGSTYSSTQSR
ncbi:uncharacterized protein STEHIDRAFT_136864 [Stereum hirsutum FP-91666 SS1]|uniref:uncharacterized protein n=1 Tax=Stereum hirsutum (strain FP-91666) TaxID=721885 RepID=UPI000440CCF3|nr:uncharacterized protein STEHIDRAFT_136864 [Stereum hirsutum FP-91666 SS1]EIM90942.1 hypothetical protein STEHIDRAFT_136864 [Stereum hirsutum FP-91666 SS1]